MCVVVESNLTVPRVREGFGVCTIVMDVMGEADTCVDLTLHPTQIRI